jgi:hypothetical protein
MESTRPTLLRENAVVDVTVGSPVKVWVIEEEGGESAEVAMGMGPPAVGNGSAAEGRESGQVGEG